MGGTQCSLGFMDVQGHGTCAVPQASFCDFPKYKSSGFLCVCLFLISKNLGEIWGLGGMVLTVKKFST